MTKCPEPAAIIAMAKAAGVPLDDGTAARVTRSIGPAFDNFAPVASDLPFDLEPAAYVVAQRKGRRA